jgi:hypothetical protein
MIIYKRKKYFMLSSKDSEQVLKQMGLTDDQITEYNALTEPFLDFHKFVMETLDVSSEKAENYTKEKTKEYILENKDYILSNNDEYKFGAKGMEKTALEIGYDKEKSSQLNDNFIKIYDFFKEHLEK